MPTLKYSASNVGVKSYVWWLFFLWCQFTILAPTILVGGFAGPVPFIHHGKVVGTRRRNQYPMVSHETCFRGSGLLANRGGTTPSHFVPKEQLQEIQDSVDIIEAIESYALPQFRRTGPDRAVVLCPFHDDTNPSLSIDGTKGIFKCFSCGTGGNIFKFVQDYAALGGEKVSFPQAIQIVQDELSTGSSMGSPPTVRGRPVAQPFLTPREQAALAVRKGRILYANLVAAAFYEKCLVTLASGGSARAHLRSRGFGPQTARAFAIGYAPDAYWGNQRGGASCWGDGSLVNHLKTEGFTAEEIVEAGLASRTRRSWPSTTGNQTDPNNATDSGGEELDHSMLIDRFRGRLVVPIFDSTGMQILGFGGRILSQENGDVPGKNVPKYLNTPESLVFQKKNILFGQHFARNATNIKTSSGKIDSRAVVVVEGYLDVVALWQAGVQEAVACMGTSLTLDQLKVAVQVNGKPSGSIVLCLDNDEAGRTAVRRLCTGGILSDFVKKYPVDIRIATLPKGIKDAADYIELHRDCESLDDKFRNEIVANSTEWREWFVDHLMSQYDPAAARGSEGSFGDIFDRIGGFLSSFSNEGELGVRASRVASELAALVARDTNTTVSATVKLQLESDLLKRAHTGAAVAKGSLPRLSRQKRKEVMKPMVSEGGKGPLDGTRVEVSGSSPVKRISMSSFSSKSKNWEVGRSRKGQRGRMRRHLPSRTPSFTSHFSGFQFLNRKDESWLGPAINKGEPQGRLQASNNDMTEQLSGRGNVYFNSNGYHGQRFVTEDAMDAGYRGSIILRDPDMFQKGLNSVIALSETGLQQFAEDILLRMLLQSPDAREATKTVLDIGYSSFSPMEIAWSSDDKAWLFSRLTNRTEGLEVFAKGNLTDLRAQLTHEFPTRCPGILVREDYNALPGQPGGQEPPTGRSDNTTLLLPTIEEVPVPHPSTSDESHESAGLEAQAASHQLPKTLNHLFSDEAVLPGFLSTDNQTSSTSEATHLAAREVLEVLRCLSAARKLSQQRSDLAELRGMVMEDGDRNATKVENWTSNDAATRGLTESQEHCSSNSSWVDPDLTYERKVAEVKESERLVESLVDSVSRWAAHMVDDAATRAGRDTSKNAYEELDKCLKEFMKNLDNWVQVDMEDGEEDFANEEDDAQDSIDMAWGNLGDDDSLWASHVSANASPVIPITPSHQSEETINDAEEPMEEFAGRIGEEWSWLGRNLVEVGGNDFEEEHYSS